MEGRRCAITELDVADCRKEERMLVVFRIHSAGKVGIYFVGKETEAG